MIFRPPEAEVIFSTLNPNPVLEMFKYGVEANGGHNTYLLLGFGRPGGDDAQIVGFGLIVETVVPNVTATFSRLSPTEVESFKNSISAIKIQLGCGVFALSESVGGICVYPSGGNRIELHWQNASETTELPLFGVVNEIKKTILEQCGHERTRTISPRSSERFGKY